MVVISEVTPLRLHAHAREPDSDFIVVGIDHLATAIGN